MQKGVGNSKSTPYPLRGIAQCARRLTPSCARHLRSRFDCLRQERLRLSARGALYMVALISMIESCNLSKSQCVRSTLAFIFTGCYNIHNLMPYKVPHNQICMCHNHHNHLLAVVLDLMVLNHKLMIHYLYL